MSLPKKVEFCLLDFNRPVEAKLCLESIRNFCKLKDYGVLYLSNGGNQDYVQEFYNQGLIDRLILRKSNNGCGLATREIFRASEAQYIVYVQVDQYMIREFGEVELNNYISILEHPYLPQKIGHIDLAGNQGNGRFSERAFIMKRDFYNSIPNGIAGPGPFHAAGKWTEEYIQDYYKENNIGFYSSLLMFKDNGCYAYRQNGDLSEWVHRTDTKQQKLVRGPVKKRDVYPKFNDLEWQRVLETQEWPEWMIPESEKQHSFVYFKEKE